ncbi:MAG: Dabb family protein [Ilumatobacteraceae bacterium]
MPYRHVELYRWADHVDDEHLNRVAEAFDGLGNRVPGVRSVTHGIDIGLSGGGYDYLVVIDVDSVLAWRALRDHPAYVLLVEELFTGHVVDRVDGQFRVERASSGLGEIDMDELSDDELMAQARRAAQASMDALMAEPDDII